MTGFAPVQDVRATLTPQLLLDQGATDLILIDLGRGQNRLGGSALAQVYNSIGQTPPDLDDAEDLKAFFAVIQGLNQDDLLLAYHDRSDGGLVTTLAEMAFAGHCGLQVQLDVLADAPSELPAVLFNEELGAVIQVRQSDTEAVLSQLSAAGLGDCSAVIGQPEIAQNFSFNFADEAVLTASRASWQRAWSETSWHIQRLRDNPDCADQEFELLADDANPGLQALISFDINEDVAAPCIGGSARPRIAILREQGVNGQVEMAAAFTRAGFTAVDVHMSDILSGRVHLEEFRGLVACGGFSYGDVLGAGEGWAKSILFNAQAREDFSAFFARPDTFALGVCNGCQMLSNLRELIPGSEHWPHFVRNRSEQFEARVAMVEIQPSPSIFLSGMVGSRLPIAIAHGEGHAEFADTAAVDACEASNSVALRYVDNRGRMTERYPANPGGSARGITGLTTRDGRVTIMMPHPERVFRASQNSWHPSDWIEDGAWMRMFRNARVWVG